MSEQEFGFETQAIRTQLERTQYLEHSVPLYLSSSLQRKKKEIYIAVLATQILLNL